MERAARLAFGIFAFVVGVPLGLGLLWKIEPLLAVGLMAGGFVLAGVMANSIGAGIRLALYRQETGLHQPQQSTTLNLPGGVGVERAQYIDAPFQDVTGLMR